MKGSRPGPAQSSSSSLPRKQSTSATQPGGPGAASDSTSSSAQAQSSSAPSSTGPGSAPGAAPARVGGPPLVLAPVSQVSRGMRKSSRTEAALAAADKATKFDPDQFCADGSRRTMYKLPHFEQSYAQAMQARYIRHTRPIEREQELRVEQIFEKK